MDISTSAMLVTAKEGSSDEAPVSVCYRLSITNPKFTGVTAVLNKVAANTIAKINIAPLISTKEKVEKILAEYTRPELSLAEVTFKGFDHHGDFNPAEHTDLDRAKKAEAEGLVEAWWRGGMNPKMGWTELLKKDKSRLDHGMSGYYKYDAETRFGEAMAHCYVDATPKQVMGYQADRRSDFGEQEILETTYTTNTGLLQLPVSIPTISDRESLYRGTTFKNDGGNSYVYVGYTIEDERRPAVRGKVRIGERSERTVLAQDQGV
jgi:hypothetical protein